MLTFFITQSSF